MNLGGAHQSNLILNGSIATIGHNILTRVNLKVNLESLSNFKNIFRMEIYLLQFPIQFRRNFTKLRVSAHNLAIETGRYAATPIDKRLCFHCKDVETEFHFILKCPFYNADRISRNDELSNISSITTCPCSSRASIQCTSPSTTFLSIYLSS